MKSVTFETITETQTLCTINFVDINKHCTLKLIMTKDFIKHSPWVQFYIDYCIQDFIQRDYKQPKKAKAANE